MLVLVSLFVCGRACVAASLLARERCACVMMLSLLLDELSCRTSACKSQQMSPLSSLLFPFAGKMPRPSSLVVAPRLKKVCDSWNQTEPRKRRTTRTLKRPPCKTRERGYREYRTTIRQGYNNETGKAQEWYRNASAERNALDIHKRCGNAGRGWNREGLVRLPLQECASE